MLAVATKQAILLYETPRGERAFRYVKEFYTPMPAKSITFIRQRYSEAFVARSISSPSRHSTNDTKHSHHHHHHHHNQSAHPHDPKDRYSTISQRSTSTRGSVIHTTQLSLFVVFDKKAIVIRIADSAVSEIDLWEDPTVRELGSPTSFRSFENASKEARNPWLPFTFIEITMSSPGPPGSPEPPPKPYLVGLLTRGRRTQIVNYPIRLPLSMPLRMLFWETQPSQVIPRILRSIDGEPKVLQVVGIGNHGVEVQEIPLPFVAGGGKGKGREVLSAISQASTDIGGQAGFLHRGGQWHEFGRPTPPPINRKDSMDSDDTQLPQRSKFSQGMYAWVQKGAEDWRVFWLGGNEQV
jgi:hypothetical protein